MQISNLVRTKRFWNNHKVKRLESQIILKSKRTKIPKQDGHKGLTVPVSGGHEPYIVLQTGRPQGTYGTCVWWT